MRPARPPAREAACLVRPSSHRQHRVRGPSQRDLAHFRDKIADSRQSLSTARFHAKRKPDTNAGPSRGVFQLGVTSAYLFTARYANTPSPTRLQKSKHMPLSLAERAEKR